MTIFVVVNTNCRCAYIFKKQTIEFAHKKNGLLSALPYIAFWLLTIVSSIVGDKLIASKKLSKTAVRKILNSFGFVVPAIAIVALGFVTCADPYIGVLLVVIGLAFKYLLLLIVDNISIYILCKF